MIVLDANILVRAVLGTQVVKLLRSFDDEAVFGIPEVCLTEARRNLVRIAEETKADEASILANLDQVAAMLEPIPASAYTRLESVARERITRGPKDWPIIATALLLSCPIWTEDRDFFGCGIATWTTATVEIYLCQPTI